MEVIGDWKRRNLLGDKRTCQKGEIIYKGGINSDCPLCVSFVLNILKKSDN